MPLAAGPFSLERANGLGLVMEIAREEKLYPAGACTTTASWGTDTSEEMKRRKAQAREPVSRVGLVLTYQVSRGNGTAPEPPKTVEAETQPSDGLPIPAYAAAGCSLPCPDDQGSAPVRVKRCWLDRRGDHVFQPGAPPPVEAKLLHWSL